MKILTSYKCPDMDGVSCMVAYSEFLNKTGNDADYYIWDTPKQEVGIVCDLFNIKLKGIENLDADNDFICVDLNGLDQMHNVIAPERIIEIIDHHSFSKYIPQYVNAKLQIEQVGAAATLVAERFKENNIEISRDSAILLYYGIISNSINLKAKITSSKDIEMANWLKEQCSDISEEKIEEIFIKKSVIDENNLRVEMECEIPIVFPEYSVIVGQIELVNIEDFLKRNKEKILNIMEQVKSEKNIDYIYLNGVDILKGETIVMGLDEKTNKYVHDLFGIEFSEDGFGKLNYLVQRKEMTRKIREANKK